MRRNPFSDLHRFDRQLWVVLVLGAVVLAWKCIIVAPVKHIGHNDAMGYAEMADSILHGQGLSVDYVSFHFIKYPEIPRPEDHWPPLYSFLIIPFYLLLAGAPIAFKMPSLVISSIFLPLTSYLFARKLSNNRWTGLATALTVMFYPRLFFWSLFALSDVTYTFLILLFAFFTIKGFDDDRYFYLMGITIGLGYYAKGTALLLIPSTIMFHLFRSRSIKTLLRDRRFLIGIGLALVLMSPFWIRNAVHFGNPFHSTQNYWAGNIGYSTDGPSNGNTYRVYWDITKPSWVATKLPLGIKTLVRYSLQYLDTQFQWAFVRMGSNPPINLKYLAALKPIRIIFEEFPRYPNGIPMALFGVPALIGLFVMRKRRDIWIIPVTFFPILIFLSVFWAPIDRLILISVPLVLALGWTAYHAFLNRLFGRRRRGEIAIASVLTLLALLTSVCSAKADYRSWQNGKSGPRNSFRGIVDEVRIYDRALEPEEISFNCRWASQRRFVTAGLISFWSFDGETIDRGSGGVRDIYGVNNGTLIGDPQIIIGKVGEALYFDGNDSVEVSSTDELDLRDAFTVETWVKGDSAPGISGTITQWLSKGSNYVFSWDHNSRYRQSIAFQLPNKDWPAARIEQPLDGDRWYHIAGTWDGQRLRIYLDGSLASETLVSGVPDIDDVPLRIGGTSSGGYFPYSHGPFERDQLAAARWIKQNTPPSAVIMDCDPWALQFYSGRRCVHFACDTPEQIFRVMRHYRVTHITYDVYEAAHPKTLDDYYSGRQPGFRLVHKVSDRLKIYEVGYKILGSRSGEGVP